MGLYGQPGNDHSVSIQTKQIVFDAQKTGWEFEISKSSLMHREYLSGNGGQLSLFTLSFESDRTIQMQPKDSSQGYIFNTQPLGEMGSIDGGPPKIWFRIDERFMIGYVPSNEQFLFGWLDLEWKWNGGVKKPFNGDSREVIGVWVSPTKETSGIFRFGKRSVAGFDLGAIGQLLGPEENGKMKALYEPVCLYLQPGLGQEEDSETICHEDYDHKFPFYSTPEEVLSALYQLPNAETYTLDSDQRF